MRAQEEKASIDHEREQRCRVALEEWLSSCPARYASASFKDVNPEIAEKIAESLEGGKWPYLFGGLGTGKTFAACATARDCAEHGMRVEMTTVPNLLGSIRGAMDNDKGNPERIVERLSKIPLLVLDDLAAEKSSDWVQETLFRIIDTRYAEMRTTVFTSNLQPSKLGNERVRSRLVECATAIALPETRPERGGK